jgi:hypothetical protein
METGSFFAGVFEMLRDKFAPKVLIASWLAAVTPLAHAAAPSGTEGVADMQLTGAQLGMLFGGAVALGIVIWLVIKFLNK